MEMKLSRFFAIFLIPVLGSVKEIQLNFAIVWDFIKFSENIQIWLIGQIYLLKSLLFEIW